jgi:hypothetical protein
VAAYQADCTEIIRNPHLDQEWAAAAVRSPTLLEAVCKAIGPSAAVENTFLVIKWPRHPFEVPWHQDGIDARLELDPDRSVAAWLALTDATETSGCLHVVPGSHRRGYLPFGPEANAGQPRGRADEARGVSGQGAIPVPVEAGHAVLMDMRLLHRACPSAPLRLQRRCGRPHRTEHPLRRPRRNPSARPPNPQSGAGQRPRLVFSRGEHVSIVDEFIRADAPTRVRVLTGEDTDAERRGDKKPVARSECTYYCPDEATARRCIKALEESDKRLRERPEEQMLWDWQATYFEAEQDNPNGGGTVILGVAWYDQEFFDDRRDAWFGVMHKRIYADLGIPLENISVEHWVRLAA